MLDRAAFLLLAFICLTIEFQSVKAIARTECPLETYGNWTQLTEDCNCNCNCYDGTDLNNGRPTSK